MSLASASGGVIYKLNANAAGDYVQYSVNITATGTYNIKVVNAKRNDRGMYQLYVDGALKSSVVDLYTSGTTHILSEVDFGNVTFSTTGNKLFKFQVTGKNASSTDFDLTLDVIKLTK